jgi:hypothetical protein
LTKVLGHDVCSKGFGIANKKGSAVGKPAHNIRGDVLGKHFMQFLGKGFCDSTRLFADKANGIGDTGVVVIDMRDSAPFLL